MPVTGARYEHGVKPSVTVAVPSALLGPASSAARPAIVPRPACELQVKSAVPGTVSSPGVPNDCGSYTKASPPLLRLREPSRMYSPARAYTYRNCRPRATFAKNDESLTSITPRSPVAPAGCNVRVPSAVACPQMSRASMSRPRRCQRASQRFAESCTAIVFNGIAASPEKSSVRPDHGANAVRIPMREFVWMAREAARAPIGADIPNPDIAAKALSCMRRSRWEPRQSLGPRVYSGR